MTFLAVLNVINMTANDRYSVSDALFALKNERKNLIAVYSWRY